MIMQIRNCIKNIKSEYIVQFYNRQCSGYVLDRGSLMLRSSMESRRVYSIASLALACA